MHRPVSTALGAAGLAASLLAAPFAAAEEMKLDRVVLSTGGVGYFEFAGSVAGAATLTLDAPVDAVDDILKSIVVFDSSGLVAQVTLPGRAPLDQLFRDLPFDQGALSSPDALLNALEGAEVSVGGSRSLEGKVLSVVPEQTLLDDGRTTTRHRVTLMTAAGLQQFILEDAEVVQFSDSELQDEVNAALDAVAAYSAADERQISVSVTGMERREVRVGYVAEAPLWKTTYRLVLEPESDTSRVQGWAVLENMSGADWEAVDLTLTSGNPVTFRQALYEAYYVDRPTVPVEVFGRVLPRADEGAMPMAKAMMDRAEREESFMARGAPAPAMMAESAVSAGAPPPMEPARGAVATESDEAAVQVAFRLSRRIDLDAGHSLTLPIIDAPVPAERVALYQPDTHASHPLVAVRLANETGSALPPGVLTLYRKGEEGLRYVGDAQLATLPDAEERIVSFALDLETRVDVDRDGTEAITNATLADGILRLTRRLEQTAHYRVSAPAGEARTMIIEHPRQPGWDLAAPEDGVTTTEDFYRIERRLAADEQAAFDVTLVRPVSDRIEVGTLSAERLAALADAATLPPETRDAFAMIAELKRAVEHRQEDLDRIEGERARLVEEQVRLRENLQAVPPDTDLHRRYLASLDRQEDQLEALAERRAAADLALREARAALSDYLSGLEL